MIDIQYTYIVLSYNFSECGEYGECINTSNMPALRAGHPSDGDSKDTGNLLNVTPRVTLN